MSRRKASQPLPQQSGDFLAHKTTTALSKRSNLLGTRPHLTSHTSNQHRTSTSQQTSTASPTPLTASPTPTSRLCVKNLPVHYTEDDITSHFSTLPGTQLTDVRVMRTPDGRSRKFAFIGLRSAEEADKVRRYYDRNFIEMSRIEVQFALERGSGQLDRAWSKYSKDSTRHAQQHGEQQPQEERKDDGHTATADGKHSTGNKQSKSSKDPLASLISSVLPNSSASSLTSDPLFHEYMQAMGGTKKAKFWENDDSGRADGAAVEGRTAVEEKERMWKLMDGKEGADDGGEASDDEYENAPVIGGDEEKAEAEQTEQQDGERLVKATLSDAHYLKARQGKAFDSEDEAEDEVQQVEEQNEEGEEVEEEQKEATPSTTEPEPELDDTRLFIRNLPFTITEDDIHTHFATYGPHPNHTHTHQQRGWERQRLCICHVLQRVARSTRTRRYEQPHRDGPTRAHTAVTEAAQHRGGGGREGADVQAAEAARVEEVGRRLDAL